MLLSLLVDSLVIIMPMDSSGTKDHELIKNYRCMALHPEVDSVIEDIINEAIVSDTNDVPS